MSAEGKRERMSHSVLSTQDLAEQLHSSQMEGNVNIAFVPVGCIEQHGPILPLETDSIIAEALVRDLCLVLEKGKFWCYQFPVVHYSPSKSNSSYSGTVSIDEEVFRAYIKEICRAILNSSFDAVILVSGHGSADPFLKEAGFGMVHDQFRNSDRTIKPVLVESVFECSVIWESLFKQKTGKHADWREFLLLYRILGKNYFDENKVHELREFQSLYQHRDCPNTLYGIPMELRSTQGVIGEPLPSEGADWEKLAEDIWQHLVTYLSDKIRKELEAFSRITGERALKYKP